MRTHPEDAHRRHGLVAALAFLAAPRRIEAQQAAKLPVIGLLVPGTTVSHGPWVAAFVKRLNELGWIEGRTVSIDYRWAEGRTDRAAELAAELARRKVDVIVTSGTAFIAAARKVAPDVSIVFAAAGDPVGTGLVTSLARPGGNVTGLSIQQTDVAAKRLQLLREVVPGLGRVAILVNVGGPAAVLDMREVQSAARPLGLETVALEIRRGEDIAPAMETLRGGADALYVVNDPLVDTHRARINGIALARRLPTMYGSREHVDGGGLMSYGTSFAAMFRRAADVVDKVLRGTKPADIPVEQSARFELVINLKIARDLGLSIPKSLLAQADELVQ